MDTTNKEFKIYNLIILDESGSMCCIERQALNGLNETLQTIRSAQQKYPEQKQYVSILPFDTNNLRLLRDKVSIDEVRDLRPDEYNPCGGTPLYDAIGFGINSLIKTVTPDDSVLVTIITDGEENSSVEFNAKSISTLIESLKKQGWLFTYIGANQDATHVAMQINISNALNFEQDDEGTKQMFAKERRSRSRFFSKHAKIFANLSYEDACAAKNQIACESNYFNDEEDNNTK